MASTYVSSTSSILSTNHANIEGANNEQGFSWPGERDQVTSHTYNFRTLINYQPPIEAAFIVDEDPTDDFDPDKAHDLQENKSLREALRFRPRSHNVTRTPQAPRDKINTWQSGRRQGLWARVSLDLSALSEKTRGSEKGKATLELLSRWENNWPYNEQPTESQDFSELQMDSICNGRLRERDVKQSMHWDKCQQGENEDGQTIGLGHPAARGCKACYEVGIECDLIDGGHYPCQACAEEEETCELIMEPKQKRACESCTKRRVVCSFRNNPDQRGSCQPCKDKGLHCIAGPKSGFTREGPSLDNPPPPSEQLIAQDKRQARDEEAGVGDQTSDRPKKKRRAIRCVSCKQNGAFCSLSKNPKAMSCGRCRKSGLTCILDDNPSFAHLTQLSASQDLQEVSSRTRKPRHWVYGDNIEFPYEGAQHCNWCVCESHGFFGLARNSEVLQGAREKATIDEGYFRASSSRMCFDCVYLRLGVMQCAVHVLSALEGASLETSGDERAFVYPGFAGLVSWKWCMVCPRKAQFQCCRDCGLRLCKDCACYLMLDAEGVLDCLIEWKERRWQTEWDLRADANFLHRNGYLMNAFQGRL